MGGDDRRRKKSKHRSRDKEDSHRDRKKSGRDKGDDGGGKEGGKLTEEEAALYAKAREYVEKEAKDRKRHRKEKKDGKRRRSESSDSGSDSDSDGGRRARKKRSHKKGKRDDDRHHKSSRHKKKSKHSHRDEEKHGRKKKGKAAQPSFRDKASKVDASKLVSLGKMVGKPPAEPLDPESDYFSHNSHLRLYLYRQFGIYFEDLSSEESHDAFKELAKAYNEGKLEEAYYEANLPQEALDQCSRTQHKWKFRVNRTEERSLEMVRAGVKKQTEYSEGGTKPSAAPAASKRPMLPARPPQEDDNAHRRKTPQELAAQRQSDKRHREHLKLVNEEMHGVGGKADHGWERKLQKRRENSAKLHGAARDRESEAYGGAELDDDALYGGSTGVGRGRGETSFGDAVAKERRYREGREAKKAARASELQKKEEDRQKKMFEALGLTGIKPGQKIQIAPRKD
ncbi:hypothetical protein ACHAXT_004276 [Thalassiosira profunda]